jgi:protocatechuate 3,4-dioxygenase beta subunit
VIALLLSLLISQNALAQATATATIRGRVVSADGQPIAGARVRVLMAPSPSTSMGDATTDQDGHYEITGTWPLPFRVAASKSGYTTAEYGERRASEPGEAITMKPGTIRERVDFVLRRHSAIVGRVLDENGELLDGVAVVVQQVRRRRRLFAASVPIDIPKVSRHISMQWPKEPSQARSTCCRVRST